MLIFMAYPTNYTGPDCHYCRLEHGKKTRQEDGVSELAVTQSNHITEFAISLVLDHRNELWNSKSLKFTAILTLHL